MSGKDLRGKRAVALRYDPGKERAPRILAKGKGRVAQKILDAARKAGIPIHEDNDLVRMLEGIEIGKLIPPALFDAVAQILAWVYRANQEWKRTHMR